MPKTFYSSITAVISNGMILRTFPVDRTCRDAWFSNLCTNAKAQGYDTSQEIVSSSTTLWIEWAEEEFILELCNNIRNRWYPSITFSAGYVESNSIFIQSRYEVKIESPDSAAIGAMWWLILLYRLYLSNPASDIDSLVIKSSAVNSGLWYSSYSDRDDHIALLKNFHLVSDAKLWLDCNMGGVACWGPNNYLEYKGMK